jgi:hypothetical protein
MRKLITGTMVSMSIVAVIAPLAIEQEAIWTPAGPQSRHESRLHCFSL